jgi:hypothetical protein
MAGQAEGEQEYVLVSTIPDHQQLQALNQVSPS